jgi:hypothetical protein
MKAIFVLGMMLVFGFAAAGQGNLDPLTGLPVIPAAETVVEGKSYGFQPGQMPEGTVCKSKMKGEFFSILNSNVKDNKVKVSTVVAWYAAHLSGFKKAQGYGSNRSQIIFSNADGTILVIITGASAAQGQDTDTYSVAYEKYQPGLSAKTIESLTKGKVECS